MKRIIGPNDGGNLSQSIKKNSAGFLLYSIDGLQKNV